MPEDRIRADGGLDGIGDERAVDEATAARNEDVLRGRIAVLEAENERLREAYTDTRRADYRRAALGLTGVGLVAFAGGILVPASETIMFALGGTGVFLGILTYALTPERFVPVAVGRAVYEAASATGDGLVGDLGLSDRRVYMPTAEGEPGSVTLFVPQDLSAPLPEPRALNETLVVDNDARGLSVRPTGWALFEQFEIARDGEISDPEALGTELADALVMQFELAGSVDPWVSPETTVERGQLTAAVTDSTYGQIDRFDHPIPSFLAVSLARSLGVPVGVSVAPAEESGQDAQVSCRWPYEVEDG